MPDKKLTDSEIVKALERCVEPVGINCCKCPLEKDCLEVNMCELALDLINRQKAEVERLKSDVSVSKDAYMSMKDRYEYEKEKVEKAKQKCIDIGKALKNAKTEAYKECIEKVKKLMEGWGDLEYYSDLIKAETDLNNLLKEMVGENNETKTF